MVGRGLIQEHPLNVIQNILSNTEMNANFHFSHYKSMENLSCHSNKSTWVTTIKKHNLTAYLKFAKLQYVSSGFRCRVITGSLMRLY